MNVLTLTGRLDSDPVRRETTHGVVCEFRLVVDGRPRLYLTVQTWGHLAGRCAQHLRAGRQVAVVGSLHHEHWINRSGERAERWYSKASNVSFLDRPSDVDNDTIDLSAASSGDR
jgi:single-strand DNA-binding protein